MRADTPACIYTYIHTYILYVTYTHTFIQTYIHIYTHTKILMSDNKILVLLPRSWSRSRDLVAKDLVLVSRPGGQGLGLGLETWWPRSWSRVFFKGLDNKSAE